MSRELSSTRRDYWRELIGEQGRSSQSVSAFCHGRGISEPSFYTWRRRLADKAAAEMKFALVETGSAGSAGSALELALATGERLRIAPGADASTLRMVLSVLRERR